MGAHHSVAEWAGTTKLAVAVVIANQGSLAWLLEAMGYDVLSPSELRHCHDFVVALSAAFSVLLGVGFIWGLLGYLNHARAQAYEAGVNAERVRRFREDEEEEVDESS